MMEKSFFNKCYCEKWLPACRKLKLDPCLSSCTSINPKWIQDLNIRPETFQFVHERADNILETIGKGKNFLSMDKWEYMKLKITRKEFVSKLKRPLTE
jgi:hypothetical protein